MTKHPMFDLIPLPGPRRKVPDVDRDPELIGELLEFDLPQPIATGIAPPAIGRDEDRVGLRIRPLAHMPPPASDGCHRKLGGVVIDPHTDPAPIVRGIVHPIGTNLAELLGFTPPFGDVGRGLVYLAPLCRGDTPCYTVSLSHAGTPPPLLPALHVPHRDRCCDAPPEPRNRAITRLPPRSGPATTPPLPGCGRPVAPAGMGHALACLAGPAESGGSGDRDAPGQTSGASASSDD